MSFSTLVVREVGRMFQLEGVALLSASSVSIRTSCQRVAFWRSAGIGVSCVCAPFIPTLPRVVAAAAVISALVPRAMTYISGVYPAFRSLSNRGGAFVCLLRLPPLCDSKGGVADS